MRQASIAPRILKMAGLSADQEEKLKRMIESNQIAYDLLVKDDFDGYFLDRAKWLLALIEIAMGKSVPDKTSEQTIQGFGESLI